jgi:peptide/nickel transport system permease protein
MRTYVIRRLLLVIPTLIIVSLIVFLVVRLIPGDIIDLMVVEREYFSQKDREDIEHALGLDAPVYIQYFRWAGDVLLHGNLGNSLWTGTPVAREIARRLPITIELTIMSIVISLVIALPIGIYSAIRQDTLGDYAGRSFAIACIALPNFWVATLVMVFGSIWLKWSPPLSVIPFTKDPLGNLGQFILPSIVLGMGYTGTNMRLTRAMMLEVLRQDYIRTAWAKGFTERVVVIRHALKNALIHVITLLGLQVPAIIAGSVIIEEIFGLPGIGRLIIESTEIRDYGVLSGVVLLLAIFVLLLNVIVDITYSYIDPRIRFK